MKLLQPTRPLSHKTLMPLLLLAALLTACGATSPVCPPVSQPLPTAPRVSTPLPPVSYSISAQQKLQTWRESLMGTRLMSD